MLLGVLDITGITVITRDMNPDAQGARTFCQIRTLNYELVFEAKKENYIENWVHLWRQKSLACVEDIVDITVFRVIKAVMYTTHITVMMDIIDFTVIKIHSIVTDITAIKGFLAIMEKTATAVIKAIMDITNVTVLRQSRHQCNGRANNISRAIMDVTNTTFIESSRTSKTSMTINISKPPWIIWTT
jgi:hypothetical protein